MTCHHNGSHFVFTAEHGAVCELNPSLQHLIQSPQAVTDMTAFIFQQWGGSRQEAETAVKFMRSFYDQLVEVK